MRLLSPIVCLLLLVVAVPSADVAAQDGQADPQGDAIVHEGPSHGPSPEYDALIDAALVEFSAGHFAEARAIFLRAHAAYPNARTLRGLGITSYELGDYPEAIRVLSEALGSSERPLSDEQRTQVMALRDRAQMLVGQYELGPSALGTRLVVDDAPTELSGWPASAGSLVLGVGEHRVGLRHPDGRMADVRVVVRGQEHELLQLELPPVAVTTSSSNAGAELEESDATPWVVAGVGGGLAALGIVLFAVGWSDYQSVDNAAFGTSWASLADAQQRAPLLTGIGISALGVGVIGGLIGVIWGVFSEGRRSYRPARARLRPSPTGLEVRF